MKIILFLKMLTLIGGEISFETYHGSTVSMIKQKRALNEGIDTLVNVEKTVPTVMKTLRMYG